MGYTQIVTARIQRHRRLGAARCKREVSAVLARKRGRNAGRRRSSRR
jgi:hypothetical protein